MTTVITFPVQEEAGELAAASGAPRPLTVHRIPVTGYAPLGAPPVKLRPRPAAQPDCSEAVPAPKPLEQHHWHSDPVDDARVDAIARSVTQAALEVLGGTRPLQQMVRWLDPESYERLQLRANLVRSREAALAGRRNTRGGTPAPAPLRLHRQVVIRCCRLCPVSEGVYEASVVAAEQNRVRAAALRIELRRGLWKITVLEIA
ncbi:Rv3235 family protein [Arthrobacter sp. 08Y14]|uniref:Rv3235 family protein n=1 Tax=Arthrobacter sp. 08Y14 TaxID=2058885 RepID=UPI000CE47340|nr:Rv3235 family protein [Arthrobacter sp. 08Y14]